MAVNREDLVRAIQNRLDRLRTTGDPTAVLEPSALVESRDLAATLHNSATDPRAHHVLGWLHWYRSQALPPAQGEFDSMLATSLLHACFLAGMTDLPEPILPALAGQAAQVAVAMVEQTRDSPDDDLFLAAVALCRRIVAATASDHPAHTQCLAALSMALNIRFTRTDAIDDLDATIEAAHALVEVVPTGTPDRAVLTSAWATMLEVRFERTGLLADLDTTIDAFAAAVAGTPPGDPSRPEHLRHLGVLLYTRFQRTGAESDLLAVIETSRETVRTVAADHAGRAAALSLLGAALLARFALTGSRTDLDTAIEMSRQAVDATPTDDPNLVSWLSNLNSALQARFRETGTRADLDAAIEAGQTAVRFSPPGHPNRAGTLSVLAAGLQSRFTQTGEPADLDATIDIGQTALLAFPKEDDRDRFVCMSNLGNALRVRFERTGAFSDLDGAIDLLGATVRAWPVGDLDRPAALHNLGAALQVRSRHTGARADLDHAISASRAAIQSAAPGHHQLPLYLSTLGNSLYLRFEQITGAHSDLDAAVDALDAAVRASSPGAPTHAGLLSNLGAALQSRFLETGTPADLDAAVQIGQAAVTATDDPGPLITLGNTLRIRFERTGERSDLADAIGVLDRAVLAASDDHVEKALGLVALGRAHRATFRLTGSDTDLSAATTAYSRAAESPSAAPALRVAAAQAAGALLAPDHPGQAARLLEKAVLLLPGVAPRRLDRPDQQHAIAEFANIAADAAAMALADPDTPTEQAAVRALGLLEAGRAVLLSQTLNTRSDLTDLRARYPKQATRFVESRDLLDQPADVLATTGTGETTAARDRRRLADAFAAILADIRALDGFGSFGLPPDFTELLAEADAGPIVVLNISRYRSDALILAQKGITALPLPTVTPEAVENQVNALHQALRTVTNPTAPPQRRIDAQSDIATILEWLWDVVTAPVLRFLGHHHSPTPGQDWPRIWWVLGGPLSMLPIHAAGHHNDPAGPDRRTTMDRVVSSCIPTIRALRHARQHLARQHGTANRSLIVAMPTTPGLPGGGRLPNVADEATLLQARLPDPVLLAEPGTDTGLHPDDLPTKANVLAHLPGTAIAHFACHGHTDPADPSRSLLLLHDHQHDPLSVAGLAPVALDHAELAYLSACSTGITTDTRLLDEAIHLVTAFQLAGFPRVIGTLWEINDHVAVRIADAFYTALTAGALDTGRAASALHHAVRAIRDECPGIPSRWAAYIHAGA